MTSINYRSLILVIISMSENVR